MQPLVTVEVKDMYLDSIATISGSDALKQLLDQTTDGVKCTWNWNVKLTVTKYTPSPVVSMEVWSMEHLLWLSLTSATTKGPSSWDFKSKN